MHTAVRRLAVGVLTATLVLPAAAPVFADHAQPVKLVGVAGDHRNEWDDFEEQSGRVPAIQQLFWPVDDGSDGVTYSGWPAAMLQELHRLGSVAYIEITTPNLRKLAAGQLAELDQLVDAVDDWLLGAPDRFLLVAPLPEANLNEHAWSGDPARFKQAFARIRAAFKDAGLGKDKVAFVFAMNGFTTKGFDYRQFYPGDASVDIIGFAKLNRGNPWRDYRTTFGMHIDEMRQKISRTKPLLITQTGTVTPRDGWLREMFTKLKSHPQVIGVVYFNKREFQVLEDGGRLEPAFRDGLRAWSPPSAHAWLFDGRLDDWVQAHGGRVSQRFGDMGPSFTTEIEWLADSGITGGCGADRFCPTAEVTREQMATFLARALDLPPAPQRQDSFDDDDGSDHEDNIERLVAADITNGCGPRRFCPGKPVSRQEMASLLAEALELDPYDGSSNTFADDEGSVHEPNIERLVDSGITGGCSPDGRFFCPKNAVTRQQMAAFLYRGLR